ncbi:MAG: 6-hydroxycyclohex-1-ene-1-carbonyl-CoA dehydrogenase [Planctomycetes bacterium]|nr:6-hydroxycyclohex-1-ene-1-carbonyl-CoA dehydrogenase [Planctomycetota bacterium]
MMRAVGAPLEREEFPLVEPRPGEALIEVAGCGVCHTDLGYLFDGVATRAALPLALGHEISGYVRAAGPGSESWIGKAVVVPAVTPCGACAVCRSGNGTICAQQTMPGNDVHGGFATHVTVPARGLCEVPGAAEAGARTLGRSDCTLAQLSVLADAVSTPYQALQRAQVGPGDLVIVIGLGGVGGFATQIASARGAVVAGFDVAAARLELLSRHGLSLGLDPRAHTPKELKAQLRALARERGARDVRWKIFECSGTAAGQELAWSLLGPGAYLSVVGFTLDKIQLRLSNLMAFDAHAAGNWGCLPELYPAALALLLDGRVAVAPFVEIHPLERAWEVLCAAREHRLERRAVLVP